MFRAAVLVMFLFAAQACTALVGDPCEAQTDCGSQMFCERSMPDGYCTLRNCTDRQCPDEGVCIVFDTDSSYCMASCETDADCRDGYVCVDDFGKHKFCNDERGLTPTTPTN